MGIFSHLPNHDKRHMRFDHNANTAEEAIRYFRNRSKQLLRFGITLNDIVVPQNGIVIAYFEMGGHLYQSSYILEGHRGEGIFKKYLTHDVITSDDCGIEGYLRKNGIDYHMVCLSSPEYDAISRFYGDQKAKRSGAYLMDHIDEGLFVLERIGASETAKAAYMLHPIIQSDEALAQNYGLLEGHGTKTIIALTEYRSVANEYLSTREIASLDEIRLSPLKDVNDMLIADKIQNRKDFEKHHLGTHPRSGELDRYFRNWLEKLGVSEEEYQATIAAMEISI